MFAQKGIGGSNMARQPQFRESCQAAYLLLHNTKDLLTKLEERTYSNRAGISYQQFLVLITIASFDPPVSQTMISRKIERNLNTISMAVDRMEKLGLVRRVRSEEDRREAHVSLTPLGNEKLAKAIEVGVALRERLCKTLTEVELQEAMRIMGKFRNQILKEMRREPVSPVAERAYRQRVIEVFREHLASAK
jgi:DNA-binding MarR family transcriptional regulator